MKRINPLAVSASVVLLLAVAALVPSGSAGAAPEKKAAPKATFEVYRDKGGEYRWRLRATNTKVLATCSDGYKEKRSCLAAIESVKRDVPDAPVEEMPATTDAPQDEPEDEPKGESEDKASDEAGGEAQE